MAGLPWPTTIRSATDPRASGSTPPNTISNSGTPIRHPDPADSDMTADDIGHESFSAPATAAPPPVYSYATSGTNPWFPQQLSINTRITRTTALGHPILLHLTSYQTPTFLANVRCTPSTSRSGTRTHPLVLCTLWRSTGMVSFADSIRSTSFTS